MEDRLNQIAERLRQVERELADPAVYSDQQRLKNLSREQKELTPVVETFTALQQTEQAIAEAREMLSDPELRELAQEELTRTKEQRERLAEELKRLLLPRDPNDEKSVVLEIRGGVGGEEGALFAADLLRMYTMYAERRARISGEMVSDLVEGTLLACGADVINVGLCTTPGTEMAVITKRADGGIIITASHNPRQWNALKLLNSDGEFLTDAEGKRVLAMAEEEGFEYPGVDGIGHVLSREPFNRTHIEQVLALPLVDAEAVRKRRFKVVVDAVNSVGGIVMPELLRRLGCEVVELNCDPTGEFAHNPEPLPENLTGIAEAIRREKADLGIVVDPDVDRLALVNEDGSMFVEEYTLVAVADYILSKNPGGDTVSNLSSSRALRDVTERHGGKYSASAVGEVNVVAKMKETGAVIGGEGNGGVIYPELHYGRDALVGTALFLTWLAHKGMTMTQLRATYPSYFASKNKIELTPAIDVDKVLREIKERYASENVNDIDGVKIDFAENWVHLRKSNTEPIIRVYTEAKSMAEADALAQRFIGEIKEICNI